MQEKGSIDWKVPSSDCGKILAAESALKANVVFGNGADQTSEDSTDGRKATVDFSEFPRDPASAAGQPAPFMPDVFENALSENKVWWTFGNELWIR